MQHQFTHQISWTKTQSQVLDSAPNIIVSGSAGSGKTLLACHLAVKHSRNKRVAILVFTKSLRTFIKEYIKSLGSNDITVMYEYEWQSRNFPHFDVIIVDEFQDFSDNDISNVIACSSIGVYLFGDIEQKIYSKNFFNESTVDLKQLIDKTQFQHINLPENFRISKENKDLISSIFKSHSLKCSAFSSGFKPRILHFEKIDDELNWLKIFLLNNTTFNNIGILLKQNDRFKGGYYYQGQLRKDDVWGIMELHKFLNENGISSAYKYKSNDNLNFSGERNINIMTYHSSKGLQFDCVILPFSNFVNENNGATNLPYVGLTRATRQIIITYSGLVADEYTVSVPASTFEGTILKRTQKDKPFLNPLFDLPVMKLLVNTAGFEYLKEEMESFDISDCKVFRH